MNEMIEISGFAAIPSDELSFRFSRSSGPGGQHVNKADTRVELLFDVAASPSLTQEQRHVIMSRLANRIDNAGVLHVFSQKTRSQVRNRELALHQFKLLMEEALVPVKARKKTRPTRQAKERRLEGKKRRGEIKKMRRKPSLEDT